MQRINVGGREFVVHTVHSLGGPLAMVIGARVFVVGTGDPGLDQKMAEIACMERINKRM